MRHGRENGQLWIPCGALRIGDDWHAGGRDRERLEPAAATEVNRGAGPARDGLSSRDQKFKQQGDKRLQLETGWAVVEKFRTKECEF